MRSLAPSMFTSCLVLSRLSLRGKKTNSVRIKYALVNIHTKVILYYFGILRMSNSLTHESTYLLLLIKFWIPNLDTKCTPSRTPISHKIRWRWLPRYRYCLCLPSAAAVSRGTLQLQACLALMMEVTGPSPISYVHVIILVICAIRLNFELLVPAYLILSGWNHYCPWQYYHGLLRFRKNILDSLACIIYFHKPYSFGLWYL
jgi:hypothetical protein